MLCIMQHMIQFLMMERGFSGFFYYFILITHIVLAIAIVPMVLISLSRALKEQFSLHKRIARITMPLWLYVSLTGVIVYFMISPFYPWAYSVSGKIENQNNQELLGVNISVENLSGIVSTSDVNGNYSISLPKGCHNLLFQYNGYQDTQILECLDRNKYVKLDVSLQLLSN